MNVNTAGPRDVRQFEYRPLGQLKQAAAMQVINSGMKKQSRLKIHTSKILKKILKKKSMKFLQKVVVRIFCRYYYKKRRGVEADPTLRILGTGM